MKQLIIDLAQCNSMFLVFFDNNKNPTTIESPFYWYH